MADEQIFRPSCLVTSSILPKHFFLNSASPTAGAPSTVKISGSIWAATEKPAGHTFRKNNISPACPRIFLCRKIPRFDQTAWRFQPWSFRKWRRLKNIFSRPVSSGWKPVSPLLVDCLLVRLGKFLLLSAELFWIEFLSKVDLPARSRFDRLFRLFPPLMTSKLMSFSAQNSSFVPRPIVFLALSLTKRNGFLKDIGQDISQGDITASLVSDIVFFA